MPARPTGNAVGRAAAAAAIVSIAAMSVGTAATVFAATPKPASTPSYETVPAPRRGIDTLPAGWSPGPAPRTIRGLAYGPAASEKLDLYLPDPQKFRGARPVIVWLHSGGWISSSRLGTTAVVQREVARGFAVASIDYALAPAHHFPAPLQDVKLAIRWVKAAATRYSFDATKVIAAGGSAGGHLATLAGVTPGRLEPRTIPRTLARFDDTVAAVIDFVGPTDLSAFDHETGSIGTSARVMGAALLGCTNAPAPALLRCPTGIERAASVSPYLSRHSPPVFMAYGASDTLVPPRIQAIPLAREWAALKGTHAVWLEVLANTGHNVSGDVLNNTYFDRFLADIVNGSVS